MSDIPTGGNEIVKQFLAWGVFPSPSNVKDSLMEDEDKVARDKNKILKEIVGRAKKLSAVQGVVSSLPGAVPGLGTAVQVAISVGTAAPETIFLLRKMAHLQLSIAHVYGHPIHDPLDPSKVHPDRIEEFAIVMGIMTGAIIPAKETAKKLGSKFVTVQISKHVSGKLLREINKRVGFTLLTKFGAKRGGIALGKVIPFGVGAAIGGGMNYASIHQFSISAKKFYEGHEEEYFMPE